MADMEGMLLTLEDENGEVKEFEQIDSVEIDGENYIALIPYGDDPQMLLTYDGQLVILKTVYDDEAGEMMYVTIDDEAEFDKVALVFEKRFDEGEDYTIEE